MVFLVLWWFIALSLVCSPDVCLAWPLSHGPYHLGRWRGGTSMTSSGRGATPWWYASFSRVLGHLCGRLVCPLVWGIVVFLCNACCSVALMTYAAASVLVARWTCFVAVPSFVLPRPALLLWCLSLPHLMGAKTSVFPSFLGLELNCVDFSLSMIFGSIDAATCRFTFFTCHAASTKAP
jgi:hypothetical protein